MHPKKRSLISQNPVVGRQADRMILWAKALGNVLVFGLLTRFYGLRMHGFHDSLACPSTQSATISATDACLIDNP